MQRDTCRPCLSDPEQPEGIFFLTPAWPIVTLPTLNYLKLSFDFVPPVGTQGSQDKLSALPLGPDDHGPLLNFPSHSYIHQFLKGAICTQTVT